jgi:hypothetical protein
MCKPIRGPVPFCTGKPIRGPFRYSTGKPIRGPFRYSTGKPIRGPFRCSTGKPIRGPFRYSTGKPIRGPFRYSTGKPIRGPVPLQNSQAGFAAPVSLSTGRFVSAFTRGLQADSWPIPISYRSFAIRLQPGPSFP